MSRRARGLRAAAAAAVASGAAAAALLAGGGDGGAGTAGAAPAAAPTTGAAAQRPRPPRGAVRRIRVPDVVGLDHQLAQDTMQAAGLWRLRERDASGQGRLLLWDRNWTVVEQSPLPGTRVHRDRTVILGSVKDEELGLPGNPVGWPALPRP